VKQTRRGLQGVMYSGSPSADRQGRRRPSIENDKNKSCPEKVAGRSVGRLIWEGQLRMGNTPRPEGDDDLEKTERTIRPLRTRITQRLQ